MKQTMFNNNSYEVILSGVGIGKSLNVYSVRDPYTGVWYMVTPNGICLRVDRDGKPYTETYEERGL